MIDIPGVKTFPLTRIINPENITFGKNIIIDDFTLVHARGEIIIGDYVHISCFTSLTGGAKITLGDFVGISQGCRILSATDDFKHWGIGNSSVPEEYRNVTRAPITIGRFVVIGANSVVLPGVTIGEGAAIGAGSVVTRDLEPWGVYIGNKKIRERDREGVMKNYERFLEDQRSNKS
jgi:acetyltransferase-like isoleucine patch superfamily enzyme